MVISPSQTILTTDSTTGYSETIFRADFGSLAKTVTIVSLLVAENLSLEIGKVEASIRTTLGYLLRTICLS